MNVDVPAGGARVVDVTYGTGQGTLQTDNEARLDYQRIRPELLTFAIEVPIDRHGE